MFEHWRISTGSMRLATSVMLGLVLAAFMFCTGQDVAAHAVLESSTPANGEVLAGSPAEIRLTFNERVQPVDGAFRLFDDSQHEIAVTARASGNDIIVEMPEDMEDGSWAMGWRVISADGHPISGLLAFAVGASTGEVTVPVEEEGAAVERTISIVQGIGYVTMFASIGLVLFQRFVQEKWPPSRVDRFLLASLGLAGIGCWLSIVPLGVIRQQGLALDSIWNWSDWSDNLDNTQVTTSLMVCGGLLLATLVAPWLSTSIGVPIALAGTVVALIGPTVSGHTRVFTPEWAMVTSNLVHTVAAAVWLGGLFGLVLASRKARISELTVTAKAGLVARFSTLAGITVSLLIPSGLLTGWLVLDGIRPFFETTWGRYVLVKLGLVLLVVCLAAWNRFRLVPVIAAAGDDAGDARVRLRRIAAAELALLVVVALITGFLVNQSPASSSATSPESVPADHHGTIPIAIEMGESALQGTVEPGHPGPNTFLFTIADAAGAPLEPRDAPQIQASLPEADLGPFVVEAAPGDEPGTFVADVPLPLSGDWEITVSVRVSTFEELRGSTTLSIPEIHEGH